MEKADLEEVLARAARREPEALTTLVELYSPRVFGLLLRLSGSREVAEDLLQETFLRLVRTIGRYEHVGRFESWLFRIAANLARDRARQAARRGTTGSLDGQSPDSLPAGLVDQASPADRLVTKEESARLAAGLAELSAIDREIVLLRHYSELPFAEIARILEVPLGTALARAHRALQHLRASMDRQA